MKTPATQLNNFIEKLAVYLQNNKPHFVEKYGVTASHVPAKDDSDFSQIRMVLNFTISNAKVRELESASQITDIEI